LEEPVRVELRGRVAWIVFSRPGKLNSLSSGLLREARLALERHCRGENSWAVAFTGEGRMFSAGVDLEEVASAKTPGDAARPFMHLHLLLAEMLECGKPVYAVLNGPAIGGGAEIALAADYAVALEGAWLQWPEVRWGLLPPMLTALARYRGDARLTLLAASMERVSPAEARALGLVAATALTQAEAELLVDSTAEALAAAPRQVTRTLLDAGRAWKREGLALARRLSELAASRELVEKAREFLARKG